MFKFYTPYQFDIVKSTCDYVAVVFPVLVWTDCPYSREGQQYALGVLLVIVIIKCNFPN